MPRIARSGSKIKLTVYKPKIMPKGKTLKNIGLFFSNNPHITNPKPKIRFMEIEKTSTSIVEDKMETRINKKLYPDIKNKIFLLRERASSASFITLFLLINWAICFDFS